MRQAGLFGLSDHSKRLSAVGDPLEVLGRVVDFEIFRPTLVAALVYGDGDVTPNLHPVAIRASASFDGPPVLSPGSM